MAMIKTVMSAIASETTHPVPVAVVTPEPIAEVKHEENVSPKGRDYPSEARGKVTFGAYVAAVTSPGVLSFSASVEEYDKNIEKYAQLIIRKTWEAQNGK